MTFDFKLEYVNAILTLGKSCGTGLAIIGLAGICVGVGVVFGSLVFALSRNPAVGLLILIISFDFFVIDFDFLSDLVLYMTSSTEIGICEDILDTLEDVVGIASLGEDEGVNDELVTELGTVLEDLEDLIDLLEDVQNQNQK